ncbi:ABC transporter substrate-binding protein [Alkalilimnicola ehrlichii]|uniref:ABC transporter substrate-binding protein n=1 Tax=Alkalilimnicola ehrlichii TaxID=351052 RepID=UPI0021622969|nr:ABC transporter substrate-binding protein [Alkalilimnicola ehrlichii]
MPSRPVRPPLSPKAAAIAGSSSPPTPTSAVVWKQTPVRWSNVWGRGARARRAPPRANDFSRQLAEAQTSGAKIVALATAGDDATNAIRQAYELGLMQGDQTVVGLLIPETLPQQLGLYVSSGVKLTTAFYWNYDDKTRDWTERFRARTGATGTMFSAGIYSVVGHYLKAIEAAGTDDPSAVIAKMRELPVEDVFARNGRLREDGRMVHDMYLAEIKRPAESTATGDYFTILQTIPGDVAFRSMEDGNCPYVE